MAGPSNFSYGDEVSNVVRGIIEEDDAVIDSYLEYCFGRESTTTGASIPRQPFHNSALTGADWVKELLNGNPQRIITQLRMSKDSFLRLCYLLENRYGFVESKRVKVHESVAIFLFMMAHGNGYRQIQERFQRGAPTIQRHVYRVLEAMDRMAVEFITVDNTAQQHRKIREIPAFFPFRNCIGALDGTHIDAFISPHLAPPFIGRKGSPTQNVLAVCDFNMRFIFVSAGWEGSMHDTRVLRNVLHRPDMNFPIPPKGKYYLADAGYPNMEGFLTPFKGERMHLQQFRQGDPPRNIEERFNRMHSSLRSEIERAFGCLKMRFQILRNMAPFEFPVQAQLVGAACTLHNFLRQYQSNCRLFTMMEESSQNSSHGAESVNSNDHDNDISDVQEMRSDMYMENIRRQICNEIIAQGQ